MTPLTPKEIDIIDCLASGWAESERMALYGNISYQDVTDLLARLGAAPPTKMIERIESIRATMSIATRLDHSVPAA
jgi:hypothetical protein